MTRYLIVFLLLFTQWCPAQQLREHGSFVVYVPKGVSTKKVPLVATFSPAGDAKGSVAVWRKVADRHGWLLYGTSSSRNGMDFDQTFTAVDRELKFVIANYPVDTGKIICSGLSGGAMVSHGMAARFPRLVRAVVANTGMMHEHFQKPGYPRDKLAVMLASPTDFRYREMQRDRKFLEQNGWQVRWLEFKGGHTFAPASSYMKAASWLKSRL